jgi:hypothetical protein
VRKTAIEALELKDELEVLKKKKEPKPEVKEEVKTDAGEVK